MAGTATAANRGHHARRGRARGRRGSARQPRERRRRARRSRAPGFAARAAGATCGHAVGERRRDRLGLAQLPATPLALGEVHDDALLVLGGERAQGVARDQLVDVFHSSSGLIPTAASASRRAFIAAKVRLFTVPMGTASRSASSDCVYPAK